MSSTHPTRRQFLSAILSTAAVTALPMSFSARAAELPKLAADDPTAKALGYLASAAKLDSTKEPAFKKGSTCANCTLYQTAQEQGGFAPCAAFPGKVVSKGGWCRVWAAKPA